VSERRVVLDRDDRLVPQGGIAGAAFEAFGGVVRKATA
jgi:hypothetical protein